MKTTPTHVIACALFLVIFVVPSAIAQPSNQDLEKLSHKDLNQQLSELNPDVFYGGLMIAGGQQRTGTFAVIDGTLDIQDGGTLEGDVWVIGGRLIMTGNARITGLVVLVDSEAFLSRTAVIEGGSRSYRCECRFKAEQWEESGKLEFEKYEDPMVIRIRPLIRVGKPTRVQYNILRLGIQRNNPRRPDPYVTGFAAVDLSLWSSTHGHFGFETGLKVPLRGHSAGLILGVYKKVFSNDYWQVSSGENATILVVTGWEFADYFESRGAEIGLEFKLTDYLDLSLINTWRKDYSLETGTAPSLFNSNQRLPDNPAIDDGDRVTLAAALVYDSREEPEWPESAWYASIWGEKGFADGPGDFSYEAFQLDLRKYSQLPYDLQLDVSGKLFSTFNPAPRQVYQSLGGYGGVRGLSDDPFAVSRGDRLVLLSGELRRPLPDVRYFSSVFTSWNWLVFYDTGLLVEATNPTDPLGFLETPYENWGKSIGLGITGESILPYVGVYVAKDLDNNYKGLRAILRFNRSF